MAHDRLGRRACAQLTLREMAVRPHATASDAVHALSLVHANGPSDDARGAGRVLMLNVLTVSRSNRGSAPSMRLAIAARCQLGDVCAEDAMAVIAMTREMATLGKDVAAGLAERLGLSVVHHELVKQGIAERAGMRESEVHRFLEGEASLLQRWKIDRKRLSRYTAHEILELAVKGNVLIRGWGATYLLRSVPHVICVRICAPMPFREQVLMKRLGIRDHLLARREIEGNDPAHNGTMQKMFGIDWTDPVAVHDRSQHRASAGHGLR